MHGLSYVRMMYIHVLSFCRGYILHARILARVCEHAWVKYAPAKAKGAQTFSNMPLMLLSQALTTSVAVWYGLETFQLRSKAEGMDEVRRNRPQ